MITHAHFASLLTATRVREALEARRILVQASRPSGSVDAPRTVRTLYSPTTGDIVAWNFGTSVRPEVAPIRVNQIGDETVESFLARGGQVQRLKSHVARGVRMTGTIRVNPTRVRTSRG